MSGPISRSHGVGGLLLAVSFLLSVVACADLALSKSASSSHVPAGAPLTYTLVVTNNSQFPASNVVLTDTLPTQVTYRSSSLAGTVGACNPSGNMLICTMPLLDSNSPATVTVQVIATGAGQATNQAIVTSDTDEQNPSNNQASASTWITVSRRR